METIFFATVALIMSGYVTFMAFSMISTDNKFEASIIFVLMLIAFILILINYPYNIIIELIKGIQ